MALPNHNPTELDAWQKLTQHFQAQKSLDISQCFREDPNRLESLHLNWEDFYVDFSKNRWTPETKALLEDLAQEAGLAEAIQAYFSGEKINQTEGRSVLHTALRTWDKIPVLVDGIDVLPEVEQTLQKMCAFSEAVIAGEWKGHTGKAITDIVNIGIGGSDLGPAMVVEALGYYRNHLQVHFMSNVEGDHVQEVLKPLNPETTLFVIVSKSFTTQETLANAQTTRKWLVSNLGETSAVAKHFVAVSTNLKQIDSFGIASENVFPMNDWVGGRFSLWSAVGLSICLAVGAEHFRALLAGAGAADQHFKEHSFAENIPVQMALLSLWYNNFWQAETHAIIPYTQYLKSLPAYLQQGIMESNGKGVDRNGNEVNYTTGNIIWGASGTNAQHAFFQLMHQGTKLIPADFIGFKESLYGEQEHQEKLMANFVAQTQALMVGKTKETVLEELKAQGKTAGEIKKIAPFKVFEGNRPTTSILIEKLTPKNIGALIGFYEHKIFVEGILWNIFSYDQWGVELGKQLANKILNSDLDSQQNLDPSTTALLSRTAN